MRKELKDIEGARKRFIATFVKFGSKKGFKGRTIKTLLFNDVRDKNGKTYCDHIWFTINLQFERLNLKPGDDISFDARVKEYWKGYRGHKDVDKPVSKDYKLSHPNNVVKHQIGEPGLLF